MSTKTILGIATGSLLVSGLMFLTFSSANTWAWNGTEGCTVEFWKSILNNNNDARAQEITGININDAVHDIISLRLDDHSAFDGFEHITNDQALDLAGDNQAEEFYKQLGAGIFNVYYGVDRLDYIEPSTEFRNIIQMAVEDENIETATSELEAANNLGCPLDDLEEKEETETTTMMITPENAKVAVINSGNKPGTSNIQLPEGYKIEPIIWNLTLPTAVTFNDDGTTMYIAEAGFAYGGLMPQPRILKVEQGSDEVEVLIDRMLFGPINDIEFHEDKLYVSHRGVISTVDPATGLKEDIIVGLPSIGDHHNNEIAFGPDGRLYWGQGTATNSGVVGIDNYHFGWLKQAPKFHDTLGMNITLAGENFETPNPLTPPPDDMATTGAFVPFGKAAEAGEAVKGDMKCNGCIISANPDGTDMQVEAWGLRNPFGLAFDNDEDDKLIVTMNGADERGSRPIAGDTDKIYSIDVSEEAKFYGWPDFYGNAEPVTEEKFQSLRGDQSLTFLMQDHPPVVEPLAQEDIAAALTGADFFTSNGEFGYEGMAFVAEFGSMIPATHSPEELTQEQIETAGHKIITVDPESGNMTDFVTLMHHDESFRPVGVEFNEQENALYFTTIAKFEVRTTLPNGTPLPMPTPWPYEHTGVIWKIVPED